MHHEISAVRRCRWDGTITGIPEPDGPRLYALTIICDVCPHRLSGGNYDTLEDAETRADEMTQRHLDSETHRLYADRREHYDRTGEWLPPYRFRK